MLRARRTSKRIDAHVFRQDQGIADRLCHTGLMERVLNLDGFLVLCQAQTEQMARPRVSLGFLSHHFATGRRMRIFS